MIVCSCGHSSFLELQRQCRSQDPVPPSNENRFAKTPTTMNCNYVAGTRQQPNAPWLVKIITCNVQQPVIPSLFDPLETIQVELPAGNRPGNFRSPGFNLSSVRSEDCCIGVAVEHKNPEVLSLALAPRKFFEATICIQSFMQRSTFPSRHPRSRLSESSHPCYTPSLRTSSWES